MLFWQVKDLEKEEIHKSKPNTKQKYEFPLQLDNTCS